MAARVTGLGHVGIYVQDLERMTDFYANFLGMTITKRSAGGTFLSGDPDAVDHEIALVKGRPSLDDPHLIQQISMGVETLDDLRDFYRRVRAEGYPVDRVVCHASAIGCYFRDPEGNPTEVFWHNGLPSWGIIAVPIDIERPNDEVMDEVRALWERFKHIKRGELPDNETATELRTLAATGAPTKSAGN